MRITPPLFCWTLVAACVGNTPAHADGDKALGRELIDTCAGCHGVPDYASAYSQFPIPKLAGQNEQYLVNALHDYRTGARTHPTMEAQAQNLSDADIKNIAAYLSSLTK